MELNAELVDQLNDLIGADRAKISADSSNELIQKLTFKMNAIKDNFVVNLPHQYNDQNEFLSLCEKVKWSREQVIKLKQEEEKIRQLIESYRATCHVEAEDDESNYRPEKELRALVLKSICIQRYSSYVKSLSVVEELNEKIERDVKSVESIKSKLVNLEAAISKSPKSKQAAGSSPNTSNNLQACVDEFNQSIETLVVTYMKLFEFAKQLLATRCDNFKKYVLQLTTYWNRTVQSLLSKEIEAQLKKLSYPNEGKRSATEQAALEKQDKQEKQLAIAASEKQFEFLASNLLRIEFSVLEGSQLDQTNLPSYMINLVLVKLLMQPIEKRFKFHFFTNRKTNNLDKPEWYFSQLLAWLKDHDEFFSRLVQPLFDENEYLKNESALVKFSNGLVRLAKEKLELDLDSLLKNQVQFSHTLDELLLFDAQLKSYLKSSVLVSGSLSTQSYTCLHFVCENTPLFNHWLSLERQVCQKKVDLMFSYLTTASSAIDNSNQDGGKTLNSLIRNENQDLDKLNEIWSCNYSDVDSMRPPQCAESFILMLKTMKDRFAQLPHPTRRLRFIQLQIELVKDFHLRLCQIARDEARNPLSKTYLGSLNAFNYIIYVLDEWKNSTFYIEMQYYKVKYDQYLKRHDTERIEGVEKNYFDEEICQRFNNLMLQTEAGKSGQISSFGSLFEIEGTLFDEVLPSYEKVKEDMISTVSNYCKWEITSRSKFYKREKWMAMASFSEYYKPTLTQSAADMFISLKNLLYLLNDSMAKSAFQSIVKRLTVELDKFFYNDIIMQNQFNEGGVLQLDYDVNKYLIPILNEFSLDVRIDNYIRMTKEALTLLKSKTGSVILLREILNKALSMEEGSASSMYDARNALKDFGVVQLNVEQARNVLNLRSDLIE